MAINIDWKNRIIHIPKNDLVLIQSSPVEIREMDLNWFRLQLKELEASPIGMCYPDTHRHNTEVSLGGLTFARVIEIINNYTITFEDGQYAVNLTGANSNVGDRVNVNQVSVRSANSAGMTSSPAIEYASFNGGVTYDQTSSYSGTAYPRGTPQMPINNMTDIMLIAKYRGFTRIYVNGNAFIDSGGDYHSMEFRGESSMKTLLNISGDANVLRCEFYDAQITGVLDGYSNIKDCTISTLHYFSGVIENSVLEPGVITLGGGADAHFLNCWSGVIGESLSIPYIDMGGSGQSLAIRNFNGSFGLQNKSGIDTISIDMNSGQVVIDTATVTNGLIRVRGIGKCIDKETQQHIPSGVYGDLTVLNELMSKYTISEAVWDEPIANHINPGSIGHTTIVSEFDSMIHVDKNRGTNGLVFPQGTHGYPVLSLDEALELDTIYNFMRIHVGGDIVLNQDMTAYTFIASNSFLVDSIDLNNRVLDHVRFQGLKVFGAMTGTDVSFIECFLENISNLSGEITGGRLSGNISVESGKTLSGIELVIEGDLTTIDLQNQPCTVSLDVNSGIITFINAVNGCLIELNLRGGEIVLDTSCIGGDFYAEGYGTLYNDSAMVIKDNHLVALETIPGPIFDTLLSGHTTTGTFGSVINKMYTFVKNIFTLSA